MFRLLALAGTASAASLTAEFNFPGKLVGTVKVSQSSRQERDNDAKWEVKFSKFDDSICPGGVLNWHVHQYGSESSLSDSPTTSDPTCLETGGHYDPTFACGGASQNNGNGICAKLRSTDQTPAGNGKVKEADSYDACGTSSQWACEIGDQSKKLGQLAGTRKRFGKQVTNTKKQRFTDKWMEPIENLKDRSLVLHCCQAGSCGPRLACANLEE